MKNLLCLLILTFLVCGCELSPQQTGNTPSTVNIISIGLNYYGTNCNRLEATINDSTEIFLAFSQLYQGKIGSAFLLQQTGENGGYDSYTKENLPTKARILSILSSVREAELTIIYYSGHGHNDGSLVTAPSSANENIFNNRELNPNCLLDVPTLLNAIKGIQGRTLLILDSCYSGSFIIDGAGTLSTVENPDAFAKVFREYFSSHAGDIGQRPLVLCCTTAGNTGKESRTWVHKHGYFTFALLEGLGWNHDSNSLTRVVPASKSQILSVDSLYQFIKTHQLLPVTGTNKNRYQHPMVYLGPDNYCLYER
ncbi:MAG: caspase family protein [Sphaerochaetaceae bacterium]